MITTTQAKLLFMVIQTVYFTADSVSKKQNINLDMDSAITLYDNISNTVSDTFPYAKQVSKEGFAEHHWQNT